jgi:hypothetical protein
MATIAKLKQEAVKTANARDDAEIAMLEAEVAFGEARRNFEQKKSDAHVALNAYRAALVAGGDDA